MLWLDLVQLLGHWKNTFWSQKNTVWVKTKIYFGLWWKILTLVDAHWSALPWCSGDQQGTPNSMGNVPRYSLNICCWVLVSLKRVPKKIILLRPVIIFLGGKKYLSGDQENTFSGQRSIILNILYFRLFRGQKTIFSVPQKFYFLGPKYGFLGPIQLACF